MEKYTLDRFEGELAVLLLRSDESIQIDIPRDQLPPEANEGDILKLSFNFEKHVQDVVILDDETSLAHKQAEDLLQKILDKNK